MILAEAQRYRGMDRSIVPIEVGTKKPPRGFRWSRYAKSRPRRREVERWFRRCDVGIAVVLGPVSGGLCCRDFDDKAAYTRWVSKFPFWASTLPTSRTHRGMHVFWRTDGYDRSLAGISAYLKVNDGEVRVSGCMSVLPPSPHPDGGNYEWVTLPWHGVPLVTNAAEIGLVPDSSKTAFRGARARCVYTYQTDRHIPRKREGKRPPAGVREAKAGGVCAGDGESVLKPNDGFDSGLERQFSSENSDPDSVLTATDRDGPQQPATHRAQLARSLPATGAPTERNSASLFDEDGDISHEGFDLWIAWTVPTGRGQHDSGIFNLARQLKSLPESRAMAVWDLEPIVRRWWQLAVPSIREKDWPYTWGKFCGAMERAFPFVTGRVAMQHILESARRAGCPLDVPVEYRSHVCGLVAAICRELALDGGGQFFLDCRTLARLLDVSHRSAATWLNALIGSRVIAKAKSHLRGRATEYRYLRSLRVPSESKAEVHGDGPKELKDILQQRVNALKINAGRLSRQARLGH